MRGLRRAAWAAILCYFVIFLTAEFNPIIHALVIPPAKAAHMRATLNIDVIQFNIEEKILAGLYPWSWVCLVSPQMHNEVIFPPVRAIDGSIRHSFARADGSMKFVSENRGIRPLLPTSQADVAPFNCAGHAPVIGNVEHSKGEFIFTNFPSQMGMQIDKQPWSFEADQCPFGNISGPIGRRYRFPHFDGLVGGSLCQQSELLFPSNPKLISGQPQADGGNGKDNCECPNDALVVPLKPVVGLFEGERRSHVEGGAVFFIIVIGGLLTVLWLYQTQCEVGHWSP